MDNNLIPKKFEAKYPLLGKQIENFIDSLIGVDKIGLDPQETHEQEYVKQAELPGPFNVKKITMNPAKFTEIVDDHFENLAKKMGLAIKENKSFTHILKQNPGSPKVELNKFKYTSPNTGKDIYVLQMVKPVGPDSYGTKIWHFYNDFGDVEAGKFLEQQKLVK